MKPLSEVIWWSAVKIISMLMLRRYYLSAWRPWRRATGFSSTQARPSGPPGSGYLLSLVQDRVALCNLTWWPSAQSGVLMDLQLLQNREADGAMSRRALAHLLKIVWQLYPFLDWGGPLIITHALVSFRLDYCNLFYMGQPLNTFGRFNWLRMKLHG